MKNAKSKITSTVCESIPAFGQELEESTAKFKMVILKKESGKELKLRLTYLGPNNHDNLNTHTHSFYYSYL